MKEIRNNTTNHHLITLSTELFEIILNHLTLESIRCLAMTDKQLKQRIYKPNYWQRKLTRIFPFIRDWSRLHLPSNIKHFFLFSTLYDHYFSTLSRDHLKLIEAITLNTIHYSHENLLMVQNSFSLSRAEYIYAKHHNGPPPDILRPYTRYQFRNTETTESLDTENFSQYCRYRLQQWCLERLCEWKYRMPYRYDNIEGCEFFEQRASQIAMVLISQNKIENYFVFINSIKYRRSCAATPAPLNLLPSLAYLLRLGHTNEINRILDFTKKNYMTAEFASYHHMKYAYISTLEYCIQYDDYKAYSAICHAMKKIHSINQIRPNTLYMMLMSNNHTMINNILGQLHLTPYLFDVTNRLLYELIRRGNCPTADTILTRIIKNTEEDGLPATKAQALKKIFKQILLGQPAGENREFIQKTWRDLKGPVYFELPLLKLSLFSLLSGITLSLLTLSTTTMSFSPPVLAFTILSIIACLAFHRLACQRRLPQKPSNLKDYPDDPIVNAHYFDTTRGKFRNNPPNVTKTHQFIDDFHGPPCISCRQPGKLTASAKESMMLNYIL